MWMLIVRLGSDKHAVRLVLIHFNTVDTLRGSSNKRNPAREDLAIDQFRMRFSMRGIVLIVTGVAVVFGILIAGLSWLVYPHVKLTIFNESSSAICDVRIDMFYAKRTAERIEPGGFAVTEFQIVAGDTVSMSYRDSIGIRRKELLYCSDEYSSSPRGSLEVHVMADGLTCFNRIYTAVDIPAWTFPAWPTGRMAVK
jgi:hypothetical protein